MATPSPSHPRPFAIAVIVVIALIIILAALRGDGRAVLIARFSATAGPAPLPQAAWGIIGPTSSVMPTAASQPSPTPVPTATAAPAPSPAEAPMVLPPPLHDAYGPQSSPTPTPLASVPALHDSAVAAELIAAGSALQFAGACDEAIPLYERSIAIDPGFSNVYTLLAFCHYEQGRVDEAMAHWQEALRRDPFAPDALAGLGTALYRQGQLEAGLERYRQAVDVDPRYADETFLRTQPGWGNAAIVDSRLLRAQPAP